MNKFFRHIIFSTLIFSLTKATNIISRLYIACTTKAGRKLFLFVYPLLYKKHNNFTSK